MRKYRLLFNWLREHSSTVLYFSSFQYSSAGELLPTISRDGHLGHRCKVPSPSPYIIDFSQRAGRARTDEAHAKIDAAAVAHGGVIPHCIKHLAPGLDGKSVCGNAITAARSTLPHGSRPCVLAQYVVWRYEKNVDLKTSGE